MAVNPIERQIIAELKVITQNKKLKASDLMEWSNSYETVMKKIQPETETYIEVKVLGMTWHCAVLKSAVDLKDVRPKL